jgi:geranylgeranyl pyrophosphate synthase
LIDDLLDFTSSEEALGKAAGADLLGGKVTLPLIYLRHAEPQAREMIDTVLREGKYSSVKQQDLIEALVGSGALEQARARANEYAEEACTALELLPDSEYCESLRALPTYILDRDR